MRLKFIILSNSMRIISFLLLTVAACIRGYSFGDHVSLASTGGRTPFETAYCSNVCATAKDGVCDDVRGRNTCALGTDCDDCGSMETLYFGEEDEWSDDDNDDANDEDNNNIMLVDVEVYESSARVYQSAMKQHITVTGSNFRNDLTLSLEPALQVGVDYTLEVTSSTSAVLSLLPGKAWRSEPGCLFVLNGDDVESTEPLSNRVCIAAVFSDPVVVPSANIVRETSTESITIGGSGFDSTEKVKVVLHPTPPGAYTTEARDGILVVTLVSGSSWLPERVANELVETQGNRGLFAVSVDTGAGPVTFDDPVQVGYIVKDTYVGVEDDSLSDADVAVDGVVEVRRRLTSTPEGLRNGTTVVHFVLAAAMLFFIIISFALLCVNTDKLVMLGAESVTTGDSIV